MISELVSKAKRENYLFVEGPDDKNVFIHLLNNHGITTAEPNRRNRFKDTNEHFEIKDCGGVDELLKAFRAALKGDTNNKRYSLVVDADTDDDAETDITVNWQRLLVILNDFGYSDLPSRPNENGTIFQKNGLPDIGIWVMPNNQLSGAIEHFISFLGPQNDELWLIAESAVRQAIAVKCNFRPSRDTMKAHLHTWLAWQEEPGRPMGLAITKRYLDANAPQALKFIAWFRKAFELDPLEA